MRRTCAKHYTRSTSDTYKLYANTFQKTRKLLARKEALYYGLNSIKKVDGYKLHKRALMHHISITPGKFFLRKGSFIIIFRLSYGAPCSDKVEKGLKTLGELVRAY